MAKPGMRVALLSPQAIFCYYIVLSFAAIVVFRLISPGSPAPLDIYTASWALSQGILSCISLFPALAMTGLIIPFGFFSQAAFLDRLFRPVLCACTAALIYSALFLLALPLAEGWEADMRYQGDIYQESWGKVQDFAAQEEWDKASRFLAVCEKIWPENPALDSLRIQISVETDRSWRREGEAPPASTGETPAEAGPLDAAQALRLSEAAFAEERYYDAHWLATLAGRLARSGSMEAQESVLAASRAWNEISSPTPASREVESGRIFRMKQAAYEAMVAGDWIRAYYRFLELADLTPKDPEAVQFRDYCQEQVAGIAFFADELEMALGDILSGAIFSLPTGDYGRIVLRFGALTAGTDLAYGLDMEALLFDAAGGLRSRVEAPSVKIVDRNLDTGPQVCILLRTLDRAGETLLGEPVWTGQAPMDSALIMLDLAYEDFLLGADTRRGVANMSLAELFAAHRSLGRYGFLPQTFQAEICRRIAEPAFLLPLLILCLVAGWRLRPEKQPKLPAFFMPVLLPIVGSGFIQLYRALIKLAGVSLSLYLDPGSTVLCIALGAAALFILSLILLAVQK